jgi:hypothetical protein
MDGWTYATDVATIATGLSALTAASVWTAGRWRAWRKYLAEKREHVWNTGYIIGGLRQFWFVRLAEDDAPDGRTGRVVLEVLRETDGESDPAMVATFREQVKRGVWRCLPPPSKRHSSRSLSAHAGRTASRSAFGRACPVGTNEE